MKRRILFIALSMVAVLVALSAGAASGSVHKLTGQQQATPSPDRLFGQAGQQPIRQIMVKFSAKVDDAALASDADAALLSDLSRAAGEELTYVRPMSGDAHVLAVNDARPPAELAVVSARLDALPEVEYAEPDLIKTIDRGSYLPLQATSLTPNDALYGSQWHYGYTAGTAEGLNLPPAWAITTGLTDTVVAVLDTGILDHPDLAGKTVPGYDMISNTSTANDGGGRDNDPSDPGDWVAANECGVPHSAQSSSWHGTHVAGTIGAASNNSIGVAGVNWQARILPVRVLGKCGGTTSDIIDAVRWAAGLPVPLAPANANPADVINLSLGGSGPCSASEQVAFNDAVAAGTTVVIAAGNSNQNAINFSPGNCNNIITVAATNRNGNRAYYSNYGSVVEVSAPGGETNTLSDGVLSTLNDGVQGPGNHIYDYYQGTSMATPHVAGLASLIKGQHPGYGPAQILTVLQISARPFPSGSSCTTSLCGAGIVDAYNALLTEVQQVYLPLITKPVQNQPPGTVPNGNFEQGPTIWTEYSLKGWPLIVTTNDLPQSVSPRSGNYAVWLGGDHNEIAYIEQSLYIPPATPHFTYWHWISSEDVCGYDVAGVLVNGSETADAYDLCASQNTGGWVKHSADLSPWAGQTVDVEIAVITDESFFSNLFVDDVSFASSAAPPADAGEASHGQTPPAVSRPERQ